MQRAMVLLAGLCAAWACAGAPAPGRYRATFCVATSQAPAGCGPAELDLRSATELQVRIADVVYRLHLHDDLVDVLTLHGRMQIDAFSAPCQWQGETLRFVDTDKQARYELRTGARLRPAH